MVDDGRARLLIDTACHRRDLPPATGDTRRLPTLGGGHRRLLDRIDFAQLAVGDQERSVVRERPQIKPRRERPLALPQQSRRTAVHVWDDDEVNEAEGCVVINLAGIVRCGERFHGGACESCSRR